jgi:hypothetical protein
MVQVSDKGFCEPLVVIVKIEARLEVWVSYVKLSSLLAVILDRTRTYQTHF